MRCKCILIITVLIAWTINHCFAQSGNAGNTAVQQHYEQQKITEQQLDRNEWKKLKQKLNIKTYTPEKKTEVKKTDKEKQDSKWDFSLSPQTTMVIKWLFFGLFIGTLLWLVLKALGINPFQKATQKNRIQITLEELEDHLDTADIDPHLYQAIKSGNFNLAIRLYYLMILQKLALTQKISWKKYKTNKHYLNELSDTDLYLPLKNLTATYEVCWFGDHTLSEQEYDTVQPAFVNFLHNIR
jgi:hypothetical protein